jgi:hypothetical protein
VYEILLFFYLVLYFSIFAGSVFVLVQWINLFPSLIPSAFYTGTVHVEVPQRMVHDALKRMEETIVTERVNRNNVTCEIIKVRFLFRRLFSLF